MVAGSFRPIVPELHRLRGVFLATFGADEIEIEASFFETIRIAKEQKSASLARFSEKG
jgi:hypothetical protein